MKDDMLSTEPFNPYRTEICIFCEEKPSVFSANGRGTTCEDHRGLGRLYTAYAGNSRKIGAHVMTRAQWYEFHIGLTDMVCRCNTCGDFYEIDEATYKSKATGIRVTCPDCIENKERLRQPDQKEPSNHGSRGPITKETYAAAPEEWGLAEFMATLEFNGANAREFLEERGYRVNVNRPGIPEKSPLQSDGVRFQP